MHLSMKKILLFVMALIFLLSACQPAAPTQNPTAIALPTTSSGGGGGGGTTTKPDYACNPFPREPRDNTIFHPNDHFDIKWTIVNTGTKTMRAGLDLKYDDGPQMTNTTLVELP